ncbi:MAG: protein kinase domain-containing protein, partial [Planctomycetaceae bacterium]
MKLTNESVLAPWQHLSTSVQSELAELLDQYACKLEAGDETAAQQLLSSHPDLSLHLQGHLESLQLLCRAASQSRLSSSSDAPYAAPAGREPQRSSRTEFLPDSHAPSTLGDYRIEREIGRGGMGIVYAATQLSLRRNVALKVLPFAAVLDQQQVARFRNEAQAAASLHHPHIVPVFAVGCERGVHYYSMQLIDGQTLEQVIKEMPLHSAGASSLKRQASSAINVANDTTLELKRPAAACDDAPAPAGH